MRLKKYLNIRWIASTVVLCALLVNSISLLAQNPDTSSTTASPAVTAGVDGKVADTASLKSASKPLISTAVDTAAASAKLLAGVKPEKDFSAEYKSVSYYVLLFFLVCVFIAIIAVSYTHLTLPTKRIV